MVNGDNGDTEKIKSLVKQVTKINVDIAALSGEEVNALSEVFSPEEQAKYLLFTDRFARNMRQIMKKKGEGKRPVARDGARERIW
jgi:hypothetical protein